MQSEKVDVDAACGSAGERCMAISVATWVGDVADKIDPMIKERLASLKVKIGVEMDAETGPIVTKAEYERITGYVAKWCRRRR